MDEYEVRFYYYDKDGDLTYHYEPFGDDKEEAWDYFRRQEPTKNHPYIKLYGICEYEEDGRTLLDEWLIDEKG